MEKKNWLQTVWDYLKKFGNDVVSETPKIYNWICGILASLAGTAVTVSFAFDKLPAAFQAVVPATVLQVIAGISLLGAAVAKRQNVKPTENAS